jgi:hypothetical protein
MLFVLCSCGQKSGTMWKNMQCVSQLQLGRESVHNRVWMHQSPHSLSLMIMWKYISFDFLLCLVLPRFEALFWSLLFTHSTLPLKVFGNHILRSTTKSLFDSCGILWFCNFPSNPQPYLQHCLWSLKCSLNSDLNNHRCVFLCLGIKALEIVIFACN